MVKNRRRGGRWELPGGRAMAGEAPLDCARREFLEETGFLLEAPTLAQRRAGALGDGHVYLGWVGKRVGEPLEDEIEAVDWFQDLPAREQLSFPDDPYPDTFKAARALLPRV
jgi:8-oxo-dGTP pyrophosphatase MutT (NUDIX family)